MQLINVDNSGEKESSFFSFEKEWNLETELHSYCKSQMKY